MEKNYRFGLLTQSPVSCDVMYTRKETCGESLRDDLPYRIHILTFYLIYKNSGWQHTHGSVMNSSIKENQWQSLVHIINFLRSGILNQKFKTSLYLVGQSESEPINYPVNRKSSRGYIKRGETQCNSRNDSVFSLLHWKTMNYSLILFAARPLIIPFSLFKRDSW